MAMFRLWLLLVFVTVGGCTQYEFNVVQPPELAQRVGRQEPTPLTREPLRYQLQAAEGRLVMHINNPTGSSIELLGDQSYVVDPKGQSHALPSQTIAANSYIKLIFPPLRPFYRAEPRVGFGVGIGVSRFDPYWPYAPDYSYPWYDPYYSAEPVYLYAAGNDETQYWTWNGQDPIRVRLTYRQGNESFQHEFVFQRVKVK